MTAGIDTMPGGTVPGWFTTSNVGFGTLAQLHIIALPHLGQDHFRVSLIADETNGMAKNLSVMDDDSWSWATER